MKNLSMTDKLIVSHLVYQTYTQNCDYLCFNPSFQKLLIIISLMNVLSKMAYYSNLMFIFLDLNLNLYTF